MKKSCKERYRAFKVRQSRGNHPQSIIVSDAEQHVCMNCNTEFRGNFCPCCGQKSNTRRLKTSNIIDNMLGHFRHLDNLFLHTLCELLYRPGYMVRDYIKGHRNEYLKPVPMIFLLAMLYIVLETILIGEVPHEKKVVNLMNLNKEMISNPILVKANDIIDMIWKNKAVRELIEILPMVPALQLCFRKTKIGKQTNQAETFHLAAYITCQNLALATIMMLISFVLFQSIQTEFGLDVIFAILTLRQFYEIKWKKAIILGILTGITYLTILLFIVIAVVLLLYMLGIFQIQGV